MSAHRESIQTDETPSGRTTNGHREEPSEHKHEASSENGSALAPSEQPRNWPAGRKWLNHCLMAIFCLLANIESPIIAPGLAVIAEQLGVKSQIVEFMIFSMFQVTYNLGSFIWGPLSEYFGRVSILFVGTAIFATFNLACGLAQTPAQMLIFRFLAGIGGATPFAVGFGTISDCFDADSRSQAIAIYNLGPSLGNTLGPMMGGFLIQAGLWRWCFFILSIATFAMLAISVVVMRETYLPVLEKRKRIRMESSEPRSSFSLNHLARLILLDTNASILRAEMQTAIARPWIMLGTQPIIQALALFYAYLYGLMLLSSATFPDLFHLRYHQELGVASLNYISLTMGFVIGSQICALSIQRIYEYLVKRQGRKASANQEAQLPSQDYSDSSQSSTDAANDKEQVAVSTTQPQVRSDQVQGIPEYRLPLTIASSLVAPIGLFLYGWSGQYLVHWIVPDIGAIIFTAGVMLGFQSINGYLIDTYARYASSALGALLIFRAVTGFSFPLFAKYMYDALGYGWGNSLLAFVAIGFGIPASLALWFWGPKLRTKSPFAAGGS
ncbi:hypothetical protein OIDMADRAFT_139660 [Oidiodendron maius Zn]|uniref:Major facilitator superfamily (MFS) profile domain-containing protein n=1 Tax=Oidiodendron maius (strain Zn) TaxID=913774 RepID=A0A0C3HV52_OIDMZ|nr:hypothetical protein OIDMADRAFT_139660 [Oidiodendron maius Zn]